MGVDFDANFKINPKIATTTKSETAPDSAQDAATLVAPGAPETVKGGAPGSIIGGEIIKAFIHTGHLKIDNEVMSKSKLNFKTIAEVLQHYTARQIRVLFIQVDYAADINYSLAQLDNAVAVESKLVNFFRNVRGLDAGAACYK